MLLACSTSFTSMLTMQPFVPWFRFLSASCSHGSYGCERAWITMSSVRLPKYLLPPQKLTQFPAVGPSHSLSVCTFPWTSFRGCTIDPMRSHKLSLASASLPTPPMRHGSSIGCPHADHLWPSDPSADVVGMWSTSWPSGYGMCYSLSSLQSTDPQD